MVMTKFYKAPHPVQVAGVYYPEGEPFSFEPTVIGKDADGKEVKSQVGADWQEIKPAEASAIEAATNPIPDHADLEALPLTALKAVAYIRYVAGIDGLDAEGLKTAIRASYEPKL
jgi:hypothetical protein